MGQTGSCFLKSHSSEILLTLLDCPNVISPVYKREAGLVEGRVDNSAGAFAEMLGALNSIKVLVIKSQV